MAAHGESAISETNMGSIMILSVAVQTEEGDVWKDVLEMPYVFNGSMGEGVLEVPTKQLSLNSGETISFYSILVKEGMGIVLNIEQRNSRLLELTCSGQLDLVCSTQQGYEVRFYTKDID